MCSKFKMSDLGLLTLYLGIEVCQAPGHITLKQSAFTAKVLEKAGMADCNAAHVPMVKGSYAAPRGGVNRYQLSTI
ncbi:hypothetical protein QYE76_040182 [Lolium multiflorum]|uniref:Reverse transcriptase Ty1/copia-type domain-containing protein n=1 Tax=Lolium multiflorum TaxID=4521 RepID=A0AAD8TCM4_LOLMU|nr:hypothetical protein QYE76_040182 [Lolium multiflorum]